MTDCNKDKFKELIHEFKFIYRKYFSDAFAARVFVCFFLELN